MLRAHAYHPKNDHSFSEKQPKIYPDIVIKIQWYTFLAQMDT